MDRKQQLANYARALKVFNEASDEQKAAFFRAVFPVMQFADWMRLTERADFHAERYHLQRTLVDDYKFTYDDADTATHIIFGRRRNDLRGRLELLLDGKCVIAIGALAEANRDVSMWSEDGSREQAVKNEALTKAVAAAKAYLIKHKFPKEGAESLAFDLVSLPAPIIAKLDGKEMPDFRAGLTRNQVRTSTKRKAR